MGNGFIGWFERSAKYIVIVLLAIAAATLVVLAMQNVRVAVNTNAQAGPIPTFSSTPRPGSLGSEPKITAGPGTRTLIFGDSWTVGYAADPEDHGYAYLTGTQMQWDTTVKGVSGTGYTNTGPNREGTYEDRINALPASLDPQLVILQGSVNDGAADGPSIHAAVVATVDALQSKYPNAQIVMFGPAAIQIPVSDALRTVDSELRKVAIAESLNYVSPIALNWITANNFDQMIDVSKLSHPSTAGHAYLAERLEDAIRQISAD